MLQFVVSCARVYFLIYVEKYKQAEYRLQQLKTVTITGFTVKRAFSEVLFLFEFNRITAAISWFHVSTITFTVTV